MEFITGTCPNCQGELQIPKGHEKIICMYCGREMDVKAAAEEKRHLSSEERQKAAEALKAAQEQFPELLFSVKDPLKDFKKSVYEASFRAYEEAQAKALQAIEDAYRLSEDRESPLKELVFGLMEKVQEQLDRKKGKRGQEDAMMNFNMCLVVYVNPALMDCNKSSGRPLVEELLRQWKERFPKTNLKPADFETINGGFKRRFCYITTAVCESQGKPDDCYELNLLREYRDGYLMKQPDGEALIRHYYDIAPTIVKRIGREGDARKVYEGIWKDYLSPCIRLIEAEDNEGCRTVYQDMIYALDKRYFHREEERE